MDVIKLCTHVTGFFPSRSVGRLQKLYEGFWTGLSVILLLATLLTFVFGQKFINFTSLSSIVGASQSLAIVSRLTFSTASFGIRKKCYLNLLDEAKQVNKWGKAILLKSKTHILSDAVISRQETFVYFFMPLILMIASNFNKIILPHLYFNLKAVKYVNQSFLLKQNSTVGVQPDSLKLDANKIVLCLSIGAVVIASFVGLKQKCLDFLLFKMYLQVIRETRILREALQDTFSDKRAFFQKFSLTNWLRYKEKLVR